MPMPTPTPPNQNGHTALLLTLGIAIVVGGVLTFQFVKTKQDTGKKSVETTTQTTSNKDQETPVPDPSENGKYLVIEDWGSRFRLPDSLEGDIYYKTFRPNASGQVSTYFASKKLDALVANGQCTFLPQADGIVHGSGLSAILTRLDPANPPQGIDLTYYRSQLTYVTKIDAYEYYFVNDTKPEVNCAVSSSDEAYRLEATLSSQVQEAFDSLEATP